ncbi:MAG: 5-(carboxyamino)imidazole ribonucleotide mutase [Porticoccus sp.]|jgi:5-(carboxyamino)imidazole ribonucleotide mutase|uniref:5-(carboxyamino)imidazole ribonucleotide mutase n=3 Tax=Porticoccus sp. TaxID=2024853 RepID=UPI000C0CDAC4|nr:5-(carboxyamino)imidazole ribonucleotide mutase [Porticoccus sp.]MAZ70064.1 5-(carboxyamino)imidazole ribonucleotide mutase [Porticoccus sp.]PHQ58628.1 MAG: 5-(carboxyamino)imidazole ribonucleotide mutase [Porticoccus sp.]|tara:strand:+ start:182127 stop:182633 length:507 start_codon:yes stop_codon:yes gene_type:complete
MNKPFIAILMGSDSDLPVMEASFEVLKKFEVPFEVKVSSAHRTPEATHRYVKDADQRGCAAFICAAGMAAHLAGAVAANTLKPVIGVPINSSLDGLDALLSTVQMPGGIPVATVAIGKAGAKNAAYLAAQIIGVSDTVLHQKLLDERADNARAILEKDAALQEKLKSL